MAAHANAGGIFSKVNAALPTGQRNHLPVGLHRLSIEAVKFIAGTAKNSGKEFFCIEGKVVATSVQGNGNCQPGSTVSIAFNTTAYPDSSASDIKSFLLSQFSEEELSKAPRHLLQESEVQQNTPEAPNPYINGQVGITWGEALRMVAFREESFFKGFLVDIEAVNKPTKAGHPFTKYYYKPAGTLTVLGPAAPATSS